MMHGAGVKHNIYNIMRVYGHHAYSLTFGRTPQVLNNTLIISTDDPFNAILILSAGKL